MTPRESFNQLSAVQKLIASLGSAGAVVLVVGLFLYLPRTQSTASLDAKLEAHATEAAQSIDVLRQQSNEQIRLLQQILDATSETARENRRQANILKLICLDQVDDKYTKLCGG